MYEFGIVKFFDRDKGFGFLYALDPAGQKTGEEVFIHRNDGRFSLGEGFTAGICKRGQRPADVPEGVELADPFKGEKLAFQRQDGKKGPKASPWVHANRKHQVRTSKPKRRKPQQLTQSAPEAVAA